MNAPSPWLLGFDLVAGLGGLAAAAVILRALIRHLRHRDARLAGPGEGQPPIPCEKAPGACIPP